MLNLKNNITRAEFAKVITGMAASYVGAEGVSGKTVEGNVIVRESGASLSGMTINGDLIIADSADKVSLDNVKVTGRIVIRGASTEASLKNSSAGKGVLVSNPNGAASLSVSGGSVGTVTAKSDLVVSGKIDNIVIAEKAALTVQSGASVGSVTVSAAGASVSGAGTVSAVQANANNVTVSTKNTKVTAASGVSGVKAGDKTVDAGKTGTVGTAPSSGGSSSGGGSSSSRSDYSYVLMNIPYGEFYKAELGENAAAVDAVSSATKNKTRIGTLAGGSYHVNPDGTDITGVTYPVRVKTSDLSGFKQVTDSDSVKITVNKKGKNEITTYTGREALFESASYSYYALSDTPSYYKEATLTNGKWTFGKATGAASEATATIAKFKTSGHHADYEMEIESDKITEGQKVSAVVLTDTDGNTYGLRHVAEIWRATELGFGKDSALVGKTISAVTYYTDDGVIKLNLEKKLYVPANAATVEADFSSGQTAVPFDLPSNFDAAYSFTVNGEASNFFTYADGKITWDESASDIPSGTYKLIIHDNSGKYADITAQINLNVYAYAAVPYDEYWKSEGVYLSGSDWKASSGVADRTQTSKDGTVIEEHDKGAFDAVSRATAIHGRHRGSFQQDVVINTTESKKYTPVYWIDADTAVVSTGDRITLNKDNIQDYKITGIKYVPVKVSASDFADFCSKYDVTKNGDTMQGGYSENNLSAYTDLVAAVDANTNGLKAVTKGKNGYTFGKRQTGTGSGIKNQALKIADNDIVATAKNYADAQNFGAHLRVDLTNPKKDGTDKNGKPTKVDVKNAYGALGDNMQTVVWKYYGNGNTVLATYGTKFAADNWMHKSMGIQLGLTDSLRFQLPEGTDGTGKWEITIYALGYSDSTFTVNMTADNVAEKVEKITDDQKTQLRALAARAQAYLDNANTKYTTNATRDALNEHAGEAADMLANADASKAEAASLIDELTKYLNELDEANASTKTVTGSAPVTGYKYNAQVTVTFDSKGKVVSVVDNNTQPSKNSSTYWNLLSGLTSAKNNFWEQFNGLDKAGVSALRIDPTDDDEHEGESNFDAVSGATYSSKAVQNAVLDAFNNLSNN